MWRLKCNLIIDQLIEAFTRREFYLLWVTRLSVVMLSNVISAYYKAFGQTFIHDDRFLSIVGAITSVFNCSGRLFYGFIMDKFAYKVSMSIEACLLIILMSTFYLTSLIGVTDAVPCDSTLLDNITTITTSPSIEGIVGCAEEIPTSLTTKVAKSLLLCDSVLCTHNQKYHPWIWWMYNVPKHSIDLNYCHYCPFLLSKNVVKCIFTFWISVGICGLGLGNLLHFPWDILYSGKHRTMRIL